MASSNKDTSREDAALPPPAIQNTAGPLASKWRWREASGHAAPATRGPGGGSESSGANGSIAVTGAIQRRRVLRSRLLASFVGPGNRKRRRRGRRGPRYAAGDPADRSLLQGRPPASVLPAGGGTLAGHPPRCTTCAGPPRACPSLRRFPRTRDGEKQRARRCRRREGPARASNGKPPRRTGPPASGRAAHPAQTAGTPPAAESRARVARAHSSWPSSRRLTPLRPDPSRAPG